MRSRLLATTLALLFLAACGSDTDALSSSMGGRPTDGAGGSVDGVGGSGDIVGGDVGGIVSGGSSAGGPCVASTSDCADAGSAGADAGSGGRSGEGGDSDPGGTPNVGPKVRTASFADHSFYRQLEGGPLGTNSYVYAAIIRAKDGISTFSSSTEIWRNGATARGWTFARLAGTANVRFRHHDAAGVVRGAALPLNMDRLNLIVFTFDGRTQTAYRNGEMMNSLSIEGISPADASDDFFVPSSSSEDDVLLADLFWSNRPEGFMDEAAVGAWSASVIEQVARGEAPEGWQGCEGQLSADDAGGSVWPDRIGNLALDLTGPVIVTDVPALF